MAAVCLVCRKDGWPLERHRIALITNPTEHPTPRTWVWLCQACVGRWRAGEPLGDLDTTAAPLRVRAATVDGTEAITARERGRPQEEDRKVSP